VCLAQGAASLITAYEKAGRIDDAGAYFNLLKGLGGAHPDLVHELFKRAFT
jgi:pentatricopeptide repeat protein